MHCIQGNKQWYWLVKFDMGMGWYLIVSIPGFCLLRYLDGLKIRTRLYEAQLSFNHGLKPRLISALLNRVVRSSIIF